MRERVVGLVIAGGMGSRMSETAGPTPKPLASVLGFPLIELVIRRLLAAGIDEIWVALRHRADEIMEAVRANSRLRAARLHFIVEDQPLGTIGALGHLADADASILAVNGDLLSAIDLVGLMVHHRSIDADLTIATHDERHRLALGEVIVGGEHRVLRYDEKPVKRYRISSGTYLIEPNVAALVQRRQWTPLPELVNRAIEAGRIVVEYHHDQPWLDVNDAEGLDRARQMLRNDPTAFGVDPEDVGDVRLRS